MKIKKRKKNRKLNRSGLTLWTKLNRRARFFKHKLEPKGGSNNKTLEYLDEYYEEFEEENIENKTE